MWVKGWSKGVAYSPEGCHRELHAVSTCKCTSVLQLHNSKCRQEYSRAPVLLACCLDVDRYYFTVLSCLFTHYLLNLTPNTHKCYMSTVVVRKDLLHEYQCPEARLSTNDARTCYPRTRDLYVDRCYSRPNIQNACVLVCLYKHMNGIFWKQ